MQALKLYGLIGYPLGHSFSKQYFTEKFHKEGLDNCVYELFPLQDITDIANLLASHPNLAGLNVTIPYKEKVLPYVHAQSQVVQQVGAANTIHIHNGRLTAHNTDVIGFEQSFAPLLQPHHTQALVLGTGGASKAVQYVLRQRNIPFILVSRHLANETLGQDIITYQDIDANMMETHNIIINCTPAGMQPNESTCPDIPYEYLTPSHYLFDMVYKPATTVFLQIGMERGATVKNGFDMLLIQAEASWKIWHEA
jgi:shikimate dehydrogenase